MWIIDWLMMQGKLCIILQLLEKIARTYTKFSKTAFWKLGTTAPFFI